MTLHPIIFFSFLIGFVSCSEQKVSNIQNRTFQPEIEIGDTVKKLGKHLWYVYQDKNKNFWFGSNGEGIFKYDGSTILNFTTKNGLSNDSIRQIKEDEMGNMYFSTMTGINKFDGKTITTLQPIESKEWKLEANDLWFHILGKNGEHGPYRYDGINLYHLEFPKHHLHDELLNRDINPLFSPYEIYCTYKDRKGVMWFGTSILGACRFDGKSIRWMYEKDLTETPAGGSFGIRSIFEDKEGSFWICNTRQRFLFDLEQTAKSDRLIYQKKNGIGNSKIFNGEECIYYSHILEDDHGDIWLTTWESVVYKYDGENISPYHVKNGSEDVNLISMYKDRQGDLWLGTPENGVYRFNGNSFERFMP